MGKEAAGAAFGVIAFLIWGLSPIYWKTLKSVPAFEILMHRMIWSFLFLAPLILLTGKGREFIEVLRDPKRISVLMGTTLLVGCNWFLFVWAINSDHVLQTSLGYYINPLVNVFLGRVFLKEELRPLQKIAVAIAGIAVLFLTFGFGRFPWVSLALAFSFGFYGLIRKTVPVPALIGLATETLLLSVPAAIYLLYLNGAGGGAFYHRGLGISLLLMGTALVTGLPLLLFTIGARRIHLATIGFLQYIAPSCTFLLAVFLYGEPLYTGQIFTFCMIWLALGIYSADAYRAYRRRNALLRPNASSP